MASGSIRIAIETDPPVAQLMAAWPGRLDAASRTAIREQTVETKLQIRAAVTGGLGTRAGNLVGGKVYGGALPLGKIFSRWWRRGRDVLGGFSTGGTIRSSSGFWLAIPLPAAGARRIGNKALTPGLWEQRTGVRLRFVYRGGRSALLVADEARLTKAGIATLKGRGLGPLGASRQRGRVSVPIFALVPSVRQPKRFDISGAAASARQGLANRFFDALAKKVGATDIPAGGETV